MSLEDEISMSYKPNGFKTDKLTSVVILNLNRHEDIRANIESLYQKTNLPFEVVIFDNGSTQKEALDYLHKINGKSKHDGNGRIKVIFNDANLGCSGGRNEAIKQVSPKAEYIATIDNDITYTDGWLEEMIQSVENDPKNAAACAKLVLSDGNIQLSGGFIERDSTGYFAEFGSFDVDKKWDDYSTNTTRKCDWLPGGAMLIKKKVADTVEHDKGYLNGYEDFDYSLQLKAKGMELVSAPKSVLVHHPYSRLDDERKIKEEDYKKQRRDSVRMFESMLLLLQRTGLNVIKHSPFFRDGIPRSVLHPYPEEFQINKPFKQFTDPELRAYFDALIEYRKSNKIISWGKEKQQPQKNVREMNEIERLLKKHSSLVSESFSKYNRHNLAHHLERRISDDPPPDPEAFFLRELMRHGELKDKNAVKTLAQQLAAEVTLKPAQSETCEIARAVEENYGMKVIGVSKLPVGSKGFLIETDKGVYFGKETSQSRIEKEMGSLETLANNGFSHLPKFVKTAKNEKNSRMPNGKGLVLFEWINGHQTTGSETELGIAGKILAELHNLPCPGKEVENKATSLLKTLEETDLSGFRSVKEVLPEAVKRIKSLEAIFPSLKTTNYHRDYSKQNLLFGKEPVLIDYESLYVGKGLEEVATSLYTFCGIWDKEGSFSGIDLQKAKAFLNGYKQKGQIDDKDINLLNDLLIMNRMAFLTYLIRTPEKEQHRIEEVVKVIKFALNNEFKI